MAGVPTKCTEGVHSGRDSLQLCLSFPQLTELTQWGILLGRAIEHRGEPQCSILLQLHNANCFPQTCLTALVARVTWGEREFATTTNRTGKKNRIGKDHENVTSFSLVLFIYCFG